MPISYSPVRESKVLVLLVWNFKTWTVLVAHVRKAVLIRSEVLVRKAPDRAVHVHGGVGLAADVNSFHHNVASENVDDEHGRVAVTFFEAVVLSFLPSFLCRTETLAFVKVDEKHSARESCDAAVYNFSLCRGGLADKRWVEANKGGLD